MLNHPYNPNLESYPAEGVPRQVSSLLERVLNSFGNLYKCLTGRFFRGRYYHRNSLVSSRPNFCVNRNLPQKRQMLAFGFQPASAVAKNLHPLAQRRYEIAHVFDNPENRHIHLLKHGNAFADYPQRSFLWSGDNHPAVERNGLAE